ncbi:MAG TPA: protoporphyrinogen oxidase [Candidatus Nitrosotalea sp.]|nr:protoporphyrinogen oxidase [Candidatus Nitrosotalea sp.]
MPAPERGVVAIVGGGITGLAAAHALSSKTERVRIVLIEAEGELGGKVRTRELAGLPVESGPDAFLTRAREAVELCQALDLGPDLIAPSRLPAQIWDGRHLHRIPAGLVLGAPVRLRPLARSGILSPRGLARAGLEPLMPSHVPAGDHSVRELIVPRFGVEVFDRLVDPLLGGIYAGSADQLSAESVLPQLVEAARGRRSLILAMRQRRPEASTQPTFYSLRGGLSRLITGLEQSLSGVKVHRGQPVEAVWRGPGGEYLLRVGSGTLSASSVILAAPAHVAARLTATLDSGLAADLAGIDHADVATVALTYARSALPRPLQSSGFLVPSRAQRLLVGMTATSSKWPHLGEGTSHGQPTFVLRAAVGRAGDTAWMAMDDDQLLASVHAELASALGLTSSPLEGWVTRWPAALPQYTVGHGARLRRLDEALGRLPGLFLAGAGYRGIGLPACIAQGQSAARFALEHTIAAARGEG